MRIALVGISCVGKSTIGKRLADKWGYDFVDFDAEVEKRMNMPIARIKNTCFNEYEYRSKVKHILPILLKEHKKDVIIAMPPSGLFHEYKAVFDRHPDILTVTLKDNAKNILSRLVFTDDDSNPIEGVVDESNIDYYYRDIKEDIAYFYATHRKAKLQFHLKGLNEEEATDALGAFIEDFMTKDPEERERISHPKKVVRNVEKKFPLSVAFYENYTIEADFCRYDVVHVSEDGRMVLMQEGEPSGWEDGYSGYMITNSKFDIVWDGDNWAECAKVAASLDSRLKKEARCRVDKNL